MHIWEKKEEGRRKKEDGRRKMEEGRRKKISYLGENSEAIDRMDKVQLRTS
ncbi:hypothetical protein [Microcoleus sp. D2_18a_B4]|uniref:hypothetical protein n=1 Tax=Microcoleus sp. D2_18a_B4 TaxID=3055329 RepID=UPI002FD2608E